jgi:hypothetical protein
MSDKTIIKHLLVRAGFLFLVFGGMSLFAATSNLVIPNERLTLRAMRILHGAQMTYAATYGNGNFGTLNSMGQAQLIDAALASGNKYGYVFTVSVRFSTPTSPADFTATATPRVYRKTGKLSFYIDTAGEIHGADKGGQPATGADPIIDDCTTGSITENELCTIQSLRTLHGAESTYAATYGNGNYAGLTELRSVMLISGSLASGQLRGYSISVVTFPQTPNEPARFRITAVPQIYGTTGIRSFFIDEIGVIRGADHQGGPADQNDPPITN